MAAPTCVRCGRPTPDGYACDNPCSRIAARQLATIAELTEAARDVAHGQSRRGPTIAGTSEARLELKPPAAARLDEIEKRLTAWAIRIAAERGRNVDLEPATRRLIDPLVVFLRARIEDSPDEVEARAVAIAVASYRSSAERIHAVVSMTRPGPAWILPTADHRKLAATFADHPDYDGSWT